MARCAALSCTQRPLPRHLLGTMQLLTDADPDVIRLHGRGGLKVHGSAEPPCDLGGHARPGRDGTHVGPTVIRDAGRWHRAGICCACGRRAASCGKGRPLPRCSVDAATVLSRRVEAAIHEQIGGRFEHGAPTVRAPRRPPNPQKPDGEAGGHFSAEIKDSASDAAPQPGGASRVAARTITSRWNVGVL